MTPARPWFGSRSWPLVTVLAWLALGLVAALASSDPLLAFGLLAAAVVVMAGLLLWQSPGLILIVLLVNIWLVAGRADPGDLLHAYPIARWLSYLIIPAFALMTALRTMLRRRRWRLTGLEPALAALVALTVVSGLINHTGPVAIVLSLAIYLRYPLLFLALYNLDLDARPYLRFARALVFVAVALTFEAIIDWAFFGKQSDNTFFTTGVNFGHVNAGLLLVYATCVVCAHAIVTRWRWYHLAFFGLVFVAAWIATVRSALILLPVLPLVMWAVQRRLLGSWRLPRLALAGLVGIVGLGIALGPNLVAKNQAYGLTYFVQLRLIGVRDVLDAMVPAGREWLGFGPRSFSPGSLGAPGEMYLLEVAKNGQYWIDNIGQSELATGFSELGLVGFAVYWLTLAYLLVTVLRFRSEYLSAEKDPRLRRRWSLLALAFTGMWLHYALFGLAYYDIWRMDPTSLIFWGVAAAIFNQRREWRRRTWRQSQAEARA